MKTNNSSAQPLAHFSYTNLDELSSIISDIWDEIKDFNIVLLSGELGSGKTALVKILGNFLQIEDEVSSPTFTLINEYIDRSGQKYYHMDMYRLKHVTEAVDLGLEDLLYSNEISFIEWPELIMDILPTKFVHLKITNSKTKRVLEIEKHG